jgi:hypothetical protein
MSTLYQEAVPAIDLPHTYITVLRYRLINMTSLLVLFRQSSLCNLTELIFLSAGVRTDWLLVFLTTFLVSYTEISVYVYERQAKLNERSGYLAEKCMQMSVEL